MPLSVIDIAAKLPVSVGAVSQHLSKLEDAGLVTVRSEGRWRFYQAARQEMGMVGDMLEAFWADRLQALKQMAEGAESRLRRAPEPPQQPRDRSQTWKTMRT